VAAPVHRPTETRVQVYARAGHRHTSNTGRYRYRPARITNCLHRSTRRVAVGVEGLASGHRSLAVRIVAQSAYHADAALAIFDVDERLYSAAPSVGLFASDVNCKVHLTRGV